MPRRVGRHHARRHAAWRAFASVVVASGAMVVASQASTTSQSPSNIARGCVGAYEPSKDYFPDKVTVEDAVNFSVTYHRSYKVVSVRDAAGAGTVERYVLVQCGAPPPTLAGRSRRGASGDRADLVAVSASPTHLLDARRFGTPRCSDRRVADEAAERRRDSRASEERPGSRIRAALSRSTRSSSSPSARVLFMTGGTASAPLAVIRSAGIPVVENNEWLEPTALARAEWLKFVALFLNEERPAQRLYGEMKTRYRNLSARATAVPDDAKARRDDRARHSRRFRDCGRPIVRCRVDQGCGGPIRLGRQRGAGVGDHRPRNAAPPCGERRHLDQRRWMAEPRHDGQGRAEIRRVQGVSSETGVGLRAAGNARRRKRLLVPLCRRTPTWCSPTW